MTYSRKSLDTAAAILAAALSNGGKLEVTAKSPNRAQHLRFACYAMRAELRRQSKEVYKVEDPLYDSTPYDKMTLELDEDKILIHSEPEKLVAVDPATGREIQL